MTIIPVTSTYTALTTSALLSQATCFPKRQWPGRASHRSCEQRTDKRPILSDLRDSGSIEQDADSVLMLYRESYYNELCDNPEITDVYLRKNRHGPTGHVELRFNESLLRFDSTNPHH